jgi:16S rRNA (guanine527-N7)-methyltransferase
VTDSAEGAGEVSGDSAHDEAAHDPEAVSSVPPSRAQAGAAIFGEHLQVAERFAAHLADTGIGHGLIGPREVPRLWDRHILNCAVIADVIPADASVIDVGSGAGLPGLCLAIARPDLQVTLVEPMERRTDWLNAVRADLALANVRVVRARAEELHGELEAGVVTARAVAPLDKLARWCLPLVRSGGRLVAMKGSSAEREIAAAERTMRRLGGAPPRIEICGAVLLSEPTRVVIVEKTARPHGPARRARSTTRR